MHFPLKHGSFWADFRWIFGGTGYCIHFFWGNEWSFSCSFRLLEILAFFAGNAHLSRFVAHQKVTKQQNFRWSSPLACDNRWIHIGMFFFLKGKEAPPVSTHGTPPKTKMEPTKNPQLKWKVIFQTSMALASICFHVNFPGRLLTINGIGSPWFSACFCVYFKRLLRHPFFVFPASGDTHFHPFFFGQNGCVILSGSRRGTWISFLVGGRTNDTNAIAS